MAKLTQVKLFGVDQLDRPVKLSADLSEFTDSKRYFHIRKLSDDVIEMVTPKGTYRLKKHASLNYYHGMCGGRKVQVSLKKVVDEVRYW